jgi:hypothetical protein
MRYVKHPVPQQIRCACVVAVAIIAAVLCFTGCSGSYGDAEGNRSQTVTGTDMSVHRVMMPKAVHSIRALHPIPTTLKDQRRVRIPADSLVELRDCHYVCIDRARRTLDRRGREI